MFIIIIITMPVEVKKLKIMVYLFSIAVTSYHKVSSLKQEHKFLMGSTEFSVPGLMDRNKSASHLEALGENLPPS